MGWLARALTADVRDDAFYFKCGFLLTDVAVYAERSPATFANLAKKQPRALTCRSDESTRVGARARSRNPLDRPSVEGERVHSGCLVSGPAHEHTVQQAAVETLAQLNRVDQGLIPQLVRSLSDRSAIVGKFPLGFCPRLGAGDTTPKGREQIVAALANAVRASVPPRSLYYGWDWAVRRRLSPD